CRWLPCRSAPAPLLAGRTVPRRPRPALASARQFLLSPYPTNSLAASWDENHILLSSCAKAPFCPAVLVLTKSILSSNRAFALIQSRFAPRFWALTWATPTPLPSFRTYPSMISGEGRGKVI